MNDSHEVWDELAAAHALHALEPAEELRLLAHVETCTTCRDRLDDYTLVAAQLGSLTDDDVEPPAWSTIRSQLPGTTPAPVVPLRRRVVATRLLAAAAAVVVVAGAAAGWELSRPGPTTATAALTACRHQVGCRIVELRGQGGTSADLLVVNGSASLVPVAMPSPPTGRMYVLWQLPRDGSPIPVASMRDVTHQSPTVSLPTGYADTAAFAVSMEAAGALPSRPSRVLATGAAPN
ncbi:MAG: anti-sigma factor [Frankiaceae bacterium]|nr:anti-sigma factor [Frankiaceae bacterium]MBV9369997.1 anti-sigma factor [Frankiales bacterium]